MSVLEIGSAYAVQLAGLVKRASVPHMPKDVSGVLYCNRKPDAHACGWLCH